MGRAVSSEERALTPGLIFLSPSGQLYGLEKFWAFLKYSKAKNLDINSKLQEYLSKFKRLEDFRVDVSRSSARTTLKAPTNTPTLQPLQGQRASGALSPAVLARGWVTPSVVPHHCSWARNQQPQLNPAIPQQLHR